MKIIDAHAHIYPPELRRDQEKIAAKERWFDILSHSSVNKWGTADELVAAMDENGVQSTYATTFAFHDQGLCREMNDYVLDAAKRYPGRILPMAVVFPNRPGAAAEIARCAETGAVGIGELFPDGQNLDLKDTMHTWRLVAACAEHKLFIMFHTAEQAGHQYPGKGAVGATDAAKFCYNHPEAHVIFAHFGAGLWAFEAMPEMKMILANARYDTAAMPWLYQEQINDAIFAIGAGDKLLFGTDWPILSVPRYQKILARTKLTEEEKNRLLFQNAQNFLTDTQN